MFLSLVYFWFFFLFMKFVFTVNDRHSSVCAFNWSLLANWKECFLLLMPPRKSLIVYSCIFLSFIWIIFASVGQELHLIHMLAGDKRFFFCYLIYKFLHLEYKSKWIMNDSSAGNEFLYTNWKMKKPFDTFVNNGACKIDKLCIKKSDKGSKPETFPSSCFRYFFFLV